MSEIVDRVAKAISDNIQAGLPDGVVVDYGYAARAAIAAMRDDLPDAIVNAGRRMDPPDQDCILVWETMIDEALK